MLEPAMKNLNACMRYQDEMEKKILAIIGQIWTLTKLPIGIPRRGTQFKDFHRFAIPFILFFGFLGLS
jgi:hypothetical protein